MVACVVECQIVSTQTYTNIFFIGIWLHQFATYESVKLILNEPPLI
jgi:hypothetical protein